MEYSIQCTVTVYTLLSYVYSDSVHYILLCLGRSVPEEQFKVYSDIVHYILLCLGQNLQGVQFTVYTILSYV